MNQSSHSYSAIIADDEENLCTHLERLLNKLWPELEISAIVHSGPEALAVINEVEPDIAFLDIKMPVLNGINVAMRAQGACHIVFITAYDEFALQAFEQDAIDYVLKPVTEARLSRTIQKLKNGPLYSANPPNLEQLLTRLASGLQNTKQDAFLQWIRAGQGDKTLLVPVDEVIYFKASDKYTSVITQNGEYIIRKSIKDLILELNPDSFWQINRGIIVNVNYIDSTRRDNSGRWEVFLKGYNDILLTSRKYSHLFRQM